uniref:Smr domain-containing protein n=1 Tax=Steinernema glaseri TaxID=37863 RepID=A0A1I7YCV1_9BILA
MAIECTHGHSSATEDTTWNAFQRTPRIIVGHQRPGALILKRILQEFTEPWVRPKKISESLKRAPVITGLDDSENLITIPKTNDPLK